MRARLALLCLLCTFRWLGSGQSSPPLLDRDDVWLLVMSVPAVMDAESRKACPALELIPLGKVRMQVMVRDGCPKGPPASATMGMYTVDLRDGHVWFDMDESKVIDSERLRRLRKVLLSREQLLAKSAAAK